MASNCPDQHGCESGPDGQSLNKSPARLLSTPIVSTGESDLGDAVP